MQLNQRLTQTVTISLLLTVWYAQTREDVSNEMARLHVHTALLIPSQAIEERPAWSPDGRFLGAKIQGRWFKLDTFSVQLQEAKWHGQRVGAIKTKPDFQPMTADEVKRWKKQVRRRKNDVVVTNSGLRIEMHHHELSSSLVINRGSTQSIIWESDLETCYGLSLSQTGMIAYVCETNGVFVMDPELAFRQNRKPRGMSPIQSSARSRSNPRN